MLTDSDGPAMVFAAFLLVAGAGCLWLVWRIATDTFGDPGEG